MRTTIRYTGGGQADYQHVVYDRNPLTGKLLILEPTFWNSDRDGGFQCVKDSRIYQNIPYRLDISAAGAPTMPPQPPGNQPQFGQSRGASPAAHRRTDHAGPW